MAMRNWWTIWIIIRSEMRMHNPPHPGEILKQDVLPELGLTVGQLAAHLGVSHPTQLARLG
jgi:plasmid maintenance system antidote protein VapI